MVATFRSSNNNSLSRCCIKLFLLTLLLGIFLVHADNETCKDSKKRVKIDGKRQRFCKWVNADPTTRCYEVYKKEKEKISKKTGSMKKRIVKFKPQKLCGCTCPSPLLTNPDDKVCPASIPEAQAMLSPFSGMSIGTGDTPNVVTYSLTSRGSCIDEGYAKGRECSYNRSWRNCTYDALKCQPSIVCQCFNDFISRDDIWTCKIITYNTCPERPRPKPDGTFPPYNVPEESGDVCLEDDAVPKDPNASSEAAEENIEIRH